MEIFSPAQLSSMAFVSAGGFLGVELPELGFTVFAPEPLIDSARFGRLHRKIMRSCLRAVMFEHHANVMPGHFEPSARSKYGYRIRTLATQRIKAKKYHHNVDLVQSGKTKRHMMNRVPNVQIKGTPEKVLTGTMRFTFPFPVSRDAKNPRHITMAVMASEISMLREDEKVRMVQRFAELYGADLRHELATRPKMQMQIDQQQLPGM